MTRMKKTSIWLTDVEDTALGRLSWERSRTRSHIIRVAIRREAGLDEHYETLQLVRGGWDTARGIWLFSAQEELVMALRAEGKTAPQIATELRLPAAGVVDILNGIDRKLDYFGDAYSD
jgi:hypothetical protein